MHAPTFAHVEGLLNQDQYAARQHVPALGAASGRGWGCGGPCARRKLSHCTCRTALTYRILQHHYIKLSTMCRHSRALGSRLQVGCHRPQPSREQASLQAARSIPRHQQPRSRLPTGLAPSTAHPPDLLAEYE